MSWKPTSIPSKRLAASITASSLTMVLNNIKGWDGEDLTSADFGSQAFGIFRNNENTVLELFEFDPSTIASASITILKRGLKFTGDLSTEVSANKLTWVRNETIVELGADVPQLFQLLKEYIDGVSVAGAADASQSTKGVVEVATAAQINSGEDLGETGAPVAMTPDQFALSQYGLYAPSSGQKDFLNGVIGMIFPYGGSSAPTGFLLCDGSAVSVATYVGLASVIKDVYGRDAGVSFTATAATDLINANSHGLSDTTPIFVRSTGTLPAGLSANTVYYVRDSLTNSFKLAETSGGAAIDITDTGSGAHTYHVSFKVPDLRSSFPVGKGQRTLTFTFAGDTAVDPSNDQITVESNNWLHTGQAVALTGSSLPTGLSATTYYVIRVNATTIKLATSVANANAGTDVDITGDGSGTCTLTLTLTSRSLGDTGGEETHALTDAEMASHKHEVYPWTGSASGSQTTWNDYDGTSTEDTNLPVPSQTIGGDEVHNNMPPYTSVNYIIKT